jgi:hypothetical protein
MLQAHALTYGSGPADVAIGTSGTSMMYELDPRAGLNLAAHVGHRVEISVKPLSGACPAH